MATTNVYFHPEIAVVEAARIAASQGCTLTWEGSRYIMRPITPPPAAEKVHNRQGSFSHRIAARVAARLGLVP